MRVAQMAKPGHQGKRCGSKDLVLSMEFLIGKRWWAKDKNALGTPIFYPFIFYHSSVALAQLGAALDTPK